MAHLGQNVNWRRAVRSSEAPGSRVARQAVIVRARPHVPWDADEASYQHQFGFYRAVAPSVSAPPTSAPAPAQGRAEAPPTPKPSPTATEASHQRSPKAYHYRPPTPAFLGKRLLNLKRHAPVPARPAAASAPPAPLWLLPEAPEQAKSVAQDAAQHDGTSREDGLDESTIRAAGVGGKSSGVHGAYGNVAISLRELNSMLHGLRAGLARSHQSRAQYVRLLEQPGTLISDLRENLSRRAQQTEDLDRELAAIKIRLGAAVADRARVEEAHAQLAESQARASAAEARAATAEVRYAALEARSQSIVAQLQYQVEEAQALLQLKSEELLEAKAVAQRLLEEKGGQPVVAAATIQQAPVAPQQQHQQQQQQQHNPQVTMGSLEAPPASSTPESPVAPPEPAPITHEVVLTYSTGWQEAFFHCNMDGKGWTEVPGLPMDSVSDNTKMIRLPCKEVEFVINNGQNNWDSIPGNYRVTAEGTYRLENGRLQRV